MKAQAWRQRQTAYMKNSQPVKKLFQGFFSAGLIQRLCNDLFEGRMINELPYLETQAQRRVLAMVLSGKPCGYNPHADPDLATAYVRAREAEAV